MTALMSDASSGLAQEPEDSMTMAAVKALATAAGMALTWDAHSAWVSDLLRAHSMAVMSDACSGLAQVPVWVEALGSQMVHDLDESSV